MILISYLVDEMVSAEVRLDRMLQGGKEVKRAMNKYRKLLVETQAMKDKNTLGHYRTKAEYLMAVGHKVVRINEELRGTVEVATAENEVQEDIFEDVMEAEIMEQPDRPRLLAAGFPGRSFVDPNTPSRSRPIGYLGQKWVNFLYGNRNFCQQSISPVCLGLQFSHSDHPEKKFRYQARDHFSGLTPVFGPFGLVSVHKYKYP